MTAQWAGGLTKLPPLEFGQAVGGGWWVASGILCKSALRQSGWSPPGQHVLDRWSHFHRWLGVTMSPWSWVMRRIPAPAQHPPTRSPWQASSSARAERASTLIFNWERVNINQEVHLCNSIHRCHSHCIAIRWREAPSKRWSFFFFWQGMKTTVSYCEMT